MKLIIKEQNKYLFDLGISCIITDNGGGELFNIVKSWQEPLSPQENIAFLSLITCNPSVVSFPNQIAEWETIKALQVPINFLPLTKEQLPENLISLTLSNLGKGRIDSRENTSHLWHSKVSLEKLEYLRVWEDLSGRLFGITPKIAPNVKWIDTDLMNPKTIHLIKEFTKLEAIILKEVGKVDIFEHLKHLDLKVISAKSPKKGYDYTKVTQFKNLEFCQLFSIKEEIDARIFLQLPKLKELWLLDCKKITHLEAFLELPNLISLEIFDAKGISEELKQALKNKIQQCKIW